MTEATSQPFPIRDFIFVAEKMPSDQETQLFDTLLEKFTSKVDGFTFIHFCLKVITSDVKVLNDLLMLHVRRCYLLREVA